MSMNTKNKFKKGAIAAALLAASSAVNAEVIVLDFEGVGDQANINEFYNGGTDSVGNSGVDYDISFGSNTLGIIDSDAGGSGNFANEPSADTIMFFLSGTAVLNYMPGFETGFSFFYSSSTVASVFVYDGLDATGNLLATLDLNAQFSDNCNGDPNGDFCNWTAIGATFNGVARSIDFGGTVNQIGYDDITFGSDVAGGPRDIPEPAGYALMALGLELIAKKRKQALAQ